jgi:hypothetical protein
VVHLAVSLLLVSPPPARFWLIPLAVAALHALPLLALPLAPPPDGTEFIPTSYLRMDFLAYASFIREVAAEGSFVLHDAFTTDPQSPRFVLLYHALAGVFARITGLSALAALEASRVPLVFAFFAALWWFLAPLLPDPRDRLAAAVLAGFAGGIEGWIRPFASALPAAIGGRMEWETSQLQGWSLFASAYNPLWLAALAMAMLVLRPLVFGERPTARALAFANAAFVALFYVHPYTAIGVAAIAAAAPATCLVLGDRDRAVRHLASGAAMAPAAIAIAAVALWQLRDPVYRAASGGILGPKSLSVLWYPVTLGGLGAIAIAGARRWLSARHPRRAEIFAWIGAIALLHSLPFANGYKFVFLLPLPLCALAGPVVREVLAGPAWRAALAGTLLFAGVGFQTVEAVRATRAESAVPVDTMNLVRALAERPEGNALVPPDVGNLLPAFAPQRVWVGHWFLTPDYMGRVGAYARLLNDANSAPRFRNLAREQRLRFVAVPSSRASIVADAFAGSIEERVPFGALELFVLRPS